METIVLNGNQSMAAIEQTRTRLLDALASHDAITIGCGGIAEADLTLVQILLAARHSAGRAGKRLRLQGVQQGALAGVLAEAGFGPRPGEAGEWSDSFWLGETD